MAIKDDQRTESEKRLWAEWEQSSAAAAAVQVAVSQLSDALSRLELDLDYATTASAGQKTKIGRIKTWCTNFSIPSDFFDKNN